MSFECPFDDCQREFDNKKGLGIHRSKSHENRFQDPDWLRQKYVEEKMDTYEMAEICGVDSGAIRRNLDKSGIERRSQSEAKKLEWESDDERREEYAERMKEVGSSHSTTYWDTYTEEEIRAVTEKRIEANSGENHPNYGEPVQDPEFVEVEKTGHTVRSGWEATVDRFLHSMGIEYGYETKTFKFADTTYTPDFILENVIIEVKGFAYEKG